jgi:hypothetical protein
LEQVLATVDPPQNDGADAPRQAVRVNLSLAISAVRGGKETADSGLDRLLENARRNLAAAVAHSR